MNEKQQIHIIQARRENDKKKKFKKNKIKVEDGWLWKIGDDRKNVRTILYICRNAEVEKNNKNVNFLFASP